MGISNKFERASNIFLAAGLGVVTALFATGGWEKTGFLWPLVYLVFVFFISDTHTWQWAIFLYAASLLVVLLGSLRIIYQPYSTVEVISYFAALGVINIFIYYFQKALTNYEAFLARDITEQKRAETRLKELTENLEKQIRLKTVQLTGIFERISVPFIALDKHWQCTYLNSRAAKVLNTSADHLIGRNIWEEFPQGVSPIYQAYHKAFDEQRYIHSEDYSAYSDRWFESDIYPSPDGVSIFFNEITQQKRTEQALKNSQEKTQLIIDSALDAIICIDKKSLITEWNPQAEMIFGWNRSEVVGRTVTETIIPEPYREKHREGMDHLLRTGEGPILNKIIELSALHRNGSIFPIELTVTPINSNEDLFFCAFVRDITRRKMAETELHELNITLQRQAEALAISNAELEQFAFLASHDLQEPLRTISGFIQLLKERYKEKLDDRAGKSIDLIFDSSERMKAVISDLLDYSRIGKNRQLASVDCNIILQNVLTDLGKIIEDTGAQIASDVLPTLPGYPTELKLLFQNLVGNALKFAKKGVPPELKITVQQKDNFWEFSFQDNGIGIDEKYHEKIFDIFKRLHSRSEYEGSGIGLAHCRKIVELHGGTIWVLSSPGSGSTFYFTIPIASTGANQSLR